MEIDWYKSDSCYAAADQPTAFAEYGKMRDALNATGRHIWFALCGWNTWYAPQGQTLGNSWRIGVDTGGGWQNVLENVEAILGLAQYAGPTSGGGGWNDMSLLLTPGETEREGHACGCALVFASTAPPVDSFEALQGWVQARHS